MSKPGAALRQAWHDRRQQLLLRCPSRDDTDDIGLYAGHAVSFYCSRLAAMAPRVTAVTLFLLIAIRARVTGLTVRSVISVTRLAGAAKSSIQSSLLPSYAE
jgi:hypothetical protein